MKKKKYLAGEPPEGEPWFVTNACEKVMEGIIAFRKANKKKRRTEGCRAEV